MVKKIKVESEMIITVVSDSSVNKEEESRIVLEVEQYLNNNTNLDINIGRKDFVCHLRTHIKGEIK
jgi:hypothetical protein